LLKIAPDWNRFSTYIIQGDESTTIKGAAQLGNSIWLTKMFPYFEQLEVVDQKLTIKQKLILKTENTLLRTTYLLQTKKDYLWMTSVNGIDRIDLKTKQVQSVFNESGKKVEVARTLYLGKDETIFFNVFGKNTLGYYNEEEMIARFYSSRTNQLKGVINDFMSDGLDGNLWIITTYGIESFNYLTHQFKTIYRNPANLSFSDFYIDRNKNDIWIIADGGLYRSHWDGKNLNHLDKSYKNILPLVTFAQIKDLHDNIMLITTLDSGLVELNIENMNYKVYSTENGLPSNVTLDVLFDEKQTPIVVTENGVSLFNKKFKQRNEITPKIVIDTIKLANNKIRTNKRNLELDYNYGSLDFDISLLAYGQSSTIEYEYLLKGVNNDWQNSGSDDNYSFMNLSAGNYLFKIRGRSNYSTWSRSKSFSFVVNPKPWRTWWAYTIYALFVLILFLWLLYIYKRKLRYEHEISHQQAKKELADAASQAKSEFLARVSHEVRTPLNGILGMSELMIDSGLNIEQKLFAQSIATSGEHLLEIINDILDLSKIEAGKLVLEQKQFDLLQLTEEVLNSFRSQAIKKKLHLSFEFNGNLEKNRTGDAVRLKQILFNLLSNAFKFTQSGEIKLSLKPLNSTVIEINVTDTGIGIAEDKIDDLFNPFTQADSSITRKYGGTGLGLAIVKQIVEMMNGEISIKSTINQTTIITFTIECELADKFKQ